MRWAVNTPADRNVSATAFVGWWGALGAGLAANRTDDSGVIRGVYIHSVRGAHQMLRPKVDWFYCDHDALVR